MKKEKAIHSGFMRRHLGDSAEFDQLCLSLGISSVSDLIETCLPSEILDLTPLDLPSACSESEVLAILRSWAGQNECYTSYIGMGYYPTDVPMVIRRNVMENPAWYTAYTPYQSEVAQGRLEALLNFQTMVSDLSGMALAGASLLDEATAAAEAMSMFMRVSASGASAKKLRVIGAIYPQTLAVLRTRAHSLGIEIEHRAYDKAFDLENERDAHSLLAILVQYPDADGRIEDYTELFAQAHARKVGVIVCADLWSLSVLKPPGEMGADVVVGSTQRFGVPMGYGGPHAAYFATKNEYKRQIPGRLIGVSKTAQGEVAYRMALQTREQHIRRERATSNICTAQVLLAVMASFYAIYHGKKGLQMKAWRIHYLTRALFNALRALDLKPLHEAFFDTLVVHMPNAALRKTLLALCQAERINLRTYFENAEQAHAVGISLNETTTFEEIETLITLFAKAVKAPSADAALAAARKSVQNNEHAIPKDLLRQTEFLTHERFHLYQTEHALLRYVRQLEEKDISLVHGMIPLGSCTMKLNASAEMQALSEDGFANIHPFAPLEQAKGYQALIGALEKQLCAITGFSALSFQPNSGAQGEYAGLCVIQAYHQSRGQTQRDTVLIPSSAHGTNPASAKIAGCRVMTIACDPKGNVSLEDLDLKLKEVGDRLSALMITYPSTHGVFESAIKTITARIHEQGGQVYMDGANMNAQIGLTSPARIGADVCHLNLHKTFCIPHGGGGPGMGPICVAAHLKPYLPTHPVIPVGASADAMVVAAAPWSSASLLTIPYAYIALMGPEGLKKASQKAILNANYIKLRLEKHYPILYANENGRVAHELIIDCRPFQKVGVSVEDVAKRLMDYGYHAPTISFPVTGTMMIEPTESEDIREIDRFCSAMIEIRNEIRDIEKGILDARDNPLKGAPHTSYEVSASAWTHAYSREQAAFPLPYVRMRKFWPPVGRIDNALGDRNLVCSCPPMVAQRDDESAHVSHA